MGRFSGMNNISNQKPAYEANCYNFFIDIKSKHVSKSFDRNAEGQKKRFSL